MSENKSIKAVEEFTQTMKRIGIEKTIAALQQARSINNGKDAHIAFVIEMVCTHFSIVFNDLVEYTGYSETMLYPRAFIIFYLDKHFDVPWADIRILFNRGQNALYKTAVRIKELDAKLAPHKQWCDAKTLFDEKVKKYKKAIK